MEWRDEHVGAAVLALDTSTEVASVAFVGPECEVSTEGKASSRSDDLIPLIDRVLTEARTQLGDITAIAVGAGPGSFTGLRIGMATAKGLCFAAQIPLWSVSSLAALALDAAAVDPLVDTLVVPVFDARRGEVCAGFFRVTDGRVEALAEDRILEPGALAAAVADLRRRESRLDRAVLVGGALTAHGAALAAAGQLLASARVTPGAASVARLALAGARVDVLRTGTPVYMQPSAAEVAFPDGNPGSRFGAGRPENK